MKTRVAFLLLVTAGACSKVTASDPVEPVIFAISNRTGHAIYLDVSAAGSPLARGVRLQKKNGEAFLAAQGCDQALCSDGCAVEACANPGAVRAILPDETWGFAWPGFIFSEGSQSCAGVPSRACLTAQGAPAGRYLATVCFGGEFEAVDGGQALVRDAQDPQVIRNARVHDSRCAAPIEFGVPGYDVRYLVELRD